MSSTLFPIQPRLTCPSCWAPLSPGELLWVSAHPDLRGDEFLGEDAARRFLPSRFDVDGFALDAEGLRCHTLACPECHLTIPRILVEFRPLFLSVLGAPSSGKSYFLASSVWQTRRKLREFHVAFTDADPVLNQVISGYEQKLFLSEDPDEVVAIPKTELGGELYQTVNYGTRTEQYARPFVFSIMPFKSHQYVANVDSTRSHARALCLYDNAGEHFQPRSSAAVSPATDHLALSEALLFVFDPIQHPGFRELCRAQSADPQLQGGIACHRQDEILLEAAKRIRQKANIAQDETYKKPLIIVVNKWDVWASLIPDLDLRETDAYGRAPNGGFALDFTVIHDVSQRVRRLCNRLAPELVGAAESFCDDVTYIPVSPQGCSPEKSSTEESGLLGIRPRALSPVWAEVPMLYGICRTKKSMLVPAVTTQAKTPHPADFMSPMRPTSGRGGGGE